MSTVEAHITEDTDTNALQLVADAGESNLSAAYLSKKRTATLIEWSAAASILVSLPAALYGLRYIQLEFNLNVLVLAPALLAPAMAIVVAVVAGLYKQQLVPDYRSETILLEPELAHTDLRRYTGRLEHLEMFINSVLKDPDYGTDVEDVLRTLVQLRRSTGDLEKVTAHRKELINELNRILCDRRSAESDPPTVEMPVIRL